MPSPPRIFDEVAVAPSELARVRATFVEPPDFAEAVDKLRTHPILVLVAPFGAGATELAYQILTHDEAQTLHRGPTRRADRSKEVTRLEAEGRPPLVRHLEALAWQPHRDHLLDLRPDQLDERFGDLEGLRETLLSKGSRLVLIARPDQYDDHLGSARDMALVVRPPDPAIVVRRHLAVEGYPAGIGRLGSGPLRDLLSDGCVPADAVRLANLLIARPQAPAEDIRQEYLGWPIPLDRHLSGEDSTPYLRALLIAAAVLGPASVEAVVVAADDLIGMRGRRRSDERDVADLLARDEIGSLLQAISLEREGEIVRLPRTRPNLDRAVVSRLWRERPAMRRALMAWFATICAPGHPAARYADAVAGMVAYLVDTQRADVFVDVIVGSLDDERTRHLAVAVLERLAGSAAVGTTVRRSLGAAQSDGRATAGRLAAIARVTGGSFGRARTELALRRLRDLLDERRAGEVRTAAMAALRRLAGDAGIRSQVLEQVIGWVEDERHRRTGSYAILGLLDPVDGCDLVNDLYYHSGVSDDWELVKAGLAELARDEDHRAEVAALMSTLHEYADDERMSPDAVAELAPAAPGAGPAA